MVHAVSEKSPKTDRPAAICSRTTSTRLRHGGASMWAEVDWLQLPTIIQDPARKQELQPLLQAGELRSCFSGSMCVCARAPCNKPYGELHLQGAVDTLDVPLSNLCGAVDT